MIPPKTVGFRRPEKNENFPG